MNTAIVIPARYASKCLPGKPLLGQTGKYLYSTSTSKLVSQAGQARRRRHR